MDTTADTLTSTSTSTPETTTNNTTIEKNDEIVNSTTTNTSTTTTTLEVSTSTPVALTTPPTENKKKDLEANIKKEYLIPPSTNGPTRKELQEKAEKERNKLKEKQKKEKRNFHERLCDKIVVSEKCEYGDKCKFSHNAEEYLKTKPKSLGKCIFFDNYGKCKFGLNCYFGEDHIVGTESIVNPEKLNVKPVVPLNDISFEVQNKLKYNGYPFPKSDQYFKDNNITPKQLKPRGKLAKQQNNSNNSSSNNNSNSNSNSSKEGEEDSECCKPEDQEEKEQEENIQLKESDRPIKKVKSDESTTVSTESNESTSVQSHEHTEIDKLIPLKENEKKQFNFKDQLILAPLTTVGNLPFRRIAKKLGADITIGEMALTTKILDGSRSELALLKKHPCEDKFGVQICGAYVDTAVRCAEFIENEVECDFVDINSGCPIDMVCNMGAGAALMEKPKKVEQLLKGISSTLSCPTTIKIRIGKVEDAPTAHKIIPLLGDYGASAITLHGRSRNQRYSRLANWDYIKQCSEVAKVPLIGNGDIYNYRDVVNIYDSSKVSSVMIARGALIKPWIFTEIKEKRDWDISATERLDLIRDYVSYGLDHWGSDKIGVDNTRKFLLNFLSFSHRYVPVGLLESVHKMNERPPPYFGRSDLETLLASNQVKDWIKISEMFLGPVSDNFVFVPKHNSNAYESQG